MPARIGTGRTVLRGSGRYRALAVLFDGTNDFLARGSDLTGAVDGKKGIFSCWLNMQGGDGAAATIFSTINANLRFKLERQADNTINIAGRNAAASVILNATSTATIAVANGWSHLLFAWDLSATICQIYINDISTVASGGTPTNDNLDYTDSDFSIGARTTAANKLNAYVADFYVNMAEYLDISVTANRRMFISEAGAPVFLGADGARPTGTVPIVFLSGAVAGFATNKGSGGGFTVTGALTGSPITP